MDKKIIQEFDCVVQDVSDDGTFGARLIDVTNPENFEEYADIYRHFIDEEEKEYIQLGAYFRWTMYDDETQTLIFNKETWTQEEIDNAHREAKELAKKFKACQMADDTTERTDD